MSGSEGGLYGRRVIFFDVDATLISTGGVGKAAMLDAGRELFGPGFGIDGISFAGRLDPLLLEEMLRLNGRPADAGAVGALYERYRLVLGRRLESPIAGGVLPGVMDLLGALGRVPNAVLGLLTGNFRETGSMKLRACGIDPARFGLHVWGNDSPRTPPCRDDLPCVGMDRYLAAFGRPIPPGAVTIIGDTPLDVGCARACGCRSLGVATGRYGVAALLEAGADHAVADLSGTEAVVRWLMGAG